MPHHNHTNQPSVPGTTAESPAEQQALQHVGHDGHSGPNSRHAHQGAARMDHDKQGGHGGHDHGTMIADFLRRFWVCLALSVPVVGLSMMFRDLTGYTIDFPYRNAVVLVLATVIYGYGGRPFLTGMVGELRTRKLGMMTLVAVAITTAYVYSAVVSVGWLRGMDFFFELATLIDIMLLGHYFEMKSVAGASRSLELIVQMLPSDAHKVDGTNVNDVKVDTLIIGDIVLVRPGERIPTDGEVVEGNSAVSESMLTGESVPVQKAEHDTVIAGAVNGEGSLKIEVTHKGADSYLNKVVNVDFGKATYRKMIQNLFWATGYNVIAIPLAAGVLYPHFVLSPALGAVLMSASTVIVALNAQLLRRSLA